MPPKSALILIEDMNVLLTSFAEAAGMSNILKTSTIPTV
jgi:hypothetical protein